mgnify:CR=1 FL=1
MPRNESIHPSIHHLFVRPFVRSLVRAFVRSFVHSLIRSLIRSLLSFFRSVVRSSLFAAGGRRADGWSVGRSLGGAGRWGSGSSSSASASAFVRDARQRHAHTHATTHRRNTLSFACTPVSPCASACFTPACCTDVLKQGGREAGGRRSRR